MTTPDPTCNGEGVRIGGYGNREVSCEVCEGTGEAGGGDALIKRIIADRDALERRGNAGGLGADTHAAIRNAVMTLDAAAQHLATLNPPTESVKAPAGVTLPRSTFNAVFDFLGGVDDAVEPRDLMIAALRSSSAPITADVKAPSGTGEQPETVEGVTQAGRKRSLAKIAQSWADRWVSHPTPAGAAMPDDAVERIEHVANAIANADLDCPDPEDYWYHLATAAIGALATNAPEATDAAKREGGA